MHPGRFLREGQRRLRGGTDRAAINEDQTAWYFCADAAKRIILTFPGVPNGGQRPSSRTATSELLCNERGGVRLDGWHRSLEAPLAPLEISEQLKIWVTRSAKLNCEDGCNHHSLNGRATICLETIATSSPRCTSRGKANNQTAVFHLHPTAGPKSPHTRCIPEADRPG